MADRTTAEIFGKIFTLLAKNPTEEHKAIARDIWKMADYDFSPSQMYADEAGLALGLARRGVRQKYPEDGETVIWLGDE